MSHQPTPETLAMIREISEKQVQEPDLFSEFESKFIAEQNERAGIFADDTHFSDKQSALVERIHAEKVRGEAVEKHGDPETFAKLKTLSSHISVDLLNKFSEFEKTFVTDLFSRVEQQGDAAVFSAKQVALVERIHAEKIRGEKVEKPKCKAKSKK